MERQESWVISTLAPSRTAGSITGPEHAVSECSAEPASEAGAEPLSTNLDDTRRTMLVLRHFLRHEKHELLIRLVNLSKHPAKLT